MDKRGTHEGQLCLATDMEDMGMKRMLSVKPGEIASQHYFPTYLPFELENLFR